MKRTLIAAAAAALLLAACSEKVPQLTSRTDTLSWAMGENVGQSLLQGQVIELDYDLFLQAVRHTLDGKEQPLSDSAYNDAMMYIMTQAQLQQMREFSNREEKVNAAQEEYFKQLLSTHPDVHKHPSGFYYEVLKAGSGRQAKFGDNVSFDYRSYYMFTGELYDQTYGQRDPIVHVIGKPMFQGLVEGLQLMQAGSIFRFYFPYQVAFGTNGSGNIPGFTPFIYEVELHKFI